ncbi:isochorismatase family protein [Desulfurispira natronophila]|uniref:Nicotinamidase-related amidase n=1 Tax=Desulfurispira natronophila TaxID=682562 RepID=A0A7W7Y395_9BACT|nr:isochorismatase family protein [Desulfurispira natronophila]MBB5021253.1 nicotinamidase-related amidase [Desulfurispira natronophila]
MTRKLDRSNTLLLVIDIQGKLAQIMPRREQILRNTAIAIQGFHILQAPVCCTEQYPKGLGHTDPAITEHLNASDPVLEKITFSACTDEVNKLLSEKHIQNVVVCGIETHICVFQSVRALVENGYGVFLLQDAVGSRSEENYQNGIDLARQMGAIITNTESVLFDLLGQAGSDEFKQISRLVK